MARRMFSPEVVCSDAFLDMPISSQALYFHLGMKADDDGFVNPRVIMRSIGAAEDDLKMILGKRFVIPFDNGVLVIKHWRMNNLVRKDFYRPTVYSEQKALLFLKENNAYTLDSSQGKTVNRLLTNRSRRLGKDRIGKVSEGKDIVPPTESPFIWKDYLKGMMESKQRHIRVIGRFFQFKGIEFDSLGEVQEAIKRHSRPAVSVGKFTNEKILQALKECSEMKDIDFTLETTLKVLTK